MFPWGFEAFASLAAIARMDILHWKGGRPYSLWVRWRLIHQRNQQVVATTSFKPTSSKPWSSLDCRQSRTSSTTDPTLSTWTACFIISCSPRVFHMSLATGHWNSRCIVSSGPILHMEHSLEAWCLTWPVGKPQEEGMMSTTVSFPLVWNQSLID
jgi:hypothetical protein